MLNNHTNGNNGNASNFNAGFDFGTTYAVASSNFDTPFLSASESNWLFNDGELKFDTKMPQPINLGMQLPMPSPQIQNGMESPFMRSSSALPLTSTGTSLPSSMPSIQAGSSTQLPPRPNTGNSGTQQQFQPNQNGSYNFSASYPSSLAGILNTNGRKKLHVHFADGSAPAPQDALNAGLTCPNVSNNSGCAQSYSPSMPASVPIAQPATARVINIGLATRNRLAKHLTVRCTANRTISSELTRYAHYNAAGFAKSTVRPSLFSV